MKTKNNKTIIALGADIKARFCVFQNNKLVLSQEFGDLSNLSNFNDFKNAILKLKVNPDIVAFDMHPGYLSSHAGDLFNVNNKIAVQHHHAHISSALFNQNFRKPVIGVAFDGTGYGSDGNLWGGEFLLVDKTGFKRAAHFKYLKMPGAEAAIKEPWRMAFSLLYDFMGKSVYKLNLECLKLKPGKDYEILNKMMDKNINCPLTSSAGRLFDAVSSILGICHKANFEAEAAIKLEKEAIKSKEKSFYEFDILENDNCFVIGYNKLLKNMLNDIKNKLPGEDIARKFHNSLAEAIIKMANKIGKVYNIYDLVLSGGVFQNKLLFDAAVKKLKDNGYNIICDKNIPLNDLSICIGQVNVALNSK
ncbi:MAG: hypothetical protein PHG69_02315 [Candidatus Omnitrophica bacterium]|nr:hypothetical protein [Candidatus Omnitrophota bacterium]